MFYAFAEKIKCLKYNIDETNNYETTLKKLTQSVANDTDDRNNIIQEEVANFSRKE